MSLIGSGMVADVFLLPTKGVVRKKYRTFLAKNFDHEVECLRRVTAINSKYFPKLVGVNRDMAYIDIEYVGQNIERADKLRLDNPQNQCQEILQELKYCGINHNDFGGNVLIQDQTLKVIDFSHAYPIKQFIIPKKNKSGLEKGLMYSFLATKPNVDGKSVLVKFNEKDEWVEFGTDEITISRPSHPREVNLDQDSLYNYVLSLYRLKGKRPWKQWFLSCWNKIITTLKYWGSILPAMRQKKITP